MIETASLVGDNKFPDYSLVKKYVSQETFDTWFRAGHPRKMDILVATVGANIGSISIMKETRGCVAQNLVALRPNKDVVSPDYLYYYLSWDRTNKQLKNLDIGAAQPSIKVPHLLDVNIPLLPLPTQRKIAAILSAYDDLIENNTRRIAILEEMAQAIYREWFVHFRFPGHEGIKRVESELGPVPEGWEVVTLGDIAEINARNIKRGQEPEHINYVNISSVSTGRIDKIEPLDFADAPGRARRIVQHGDIIWSTVRPNRRSYSIIFDPLPNMIVSTGFAVITAFEVPYTYLYYAVTTDEFAGYLTNNATGSAYPAVNAADFEKATILLPPKQLTDSFQNIVENIFGLKHNLSAKNTTLRQTRDLLLPRFISGEVDVSGLEMAMAGIEHG